MNEYIKKQIFFILKNESIDEEKINSIVRKITDLFIQEADIELPKSLEVTTPLFSGFVFLCEQGNKFFYKNTQGGIVIHPASKKVMQGKIKKYLGK